MSKWNLLLEGNLHIHVRLTGIMGCLRSVSTLHPVTSMFIPEHLFQVGHLNALQFSIRLSWRLSTVWNTRQILLRMHAHPLRDILQFNITTVNMCGLVLAGAPRGASQAVQEGWGGGAHGPAAVLPELLRAHAGVPDRVHPGAAAAALQASSQRALLPRNSNHQLHRGHSQPGLPQVGHQFPQGRGEADAYRGGGAGG